MVSALASINEVNLRRARLVRRWSTLSRFNSRCRTFISVCNQPDIQGQLNPPSLRGRLMYQLRLGGKGKGMVHSVSGCTRGVQIKLWDLLRTRAIPERLRCVFTTRRYTNPRLPLSLPYFNLCVNSLAARRSDSKSCRCLMSSKQQWHWVTTWPVVLSICRSVGSACK